MLIARHRLIAVPLFIPLLFFTGPLAQAKVSCSIYDDLLVQSKSGFTNLRGAPTESSWWDGHEVEGFNSTLRIPNADCFISAIPATGESWFKCYWIFPDAGVGAVMRQYRQMTQTLRDCLIDQNPQEKIEDHGYYEARSFLVEGGTEFHVQPLGDDMPNQIMLTVSRVGN